MFMLVCCLFVLFSIFSSFLLNRSISSTIRDKIEMSDDDYDWSNRRLQIGRNSKDDNQHLNQLKDEQQTSNTADYEMQSSIRK